MYVRAKKRGEHIYYYLVENQRLGGRPRQKVIKYLGKQKPPSKEVARLVEHFKRGVR